MALQYSVTANNARLDAIEAAAGTAPKLRMYMGSMPANCAAAATGTMLVEITLPSDWMSNAASGVKAKTGTWSNNAVAAGTADYFRLVDTAGTTTHIQGTCAASGADMNMDNRSIAVSQLVTVNTFQLTASNA